jgi:[ribosomal protein S5]-alanine N-acetyltransferase
MDSEGDPASTICNLELSQSSDRCIGIWSSKSTVLKAATTSCCYGCLLNHRVETTLGRRRIHHWVSSVIETVETSRLRLVPPSRACEKAYEAFYTDREASRMYGGPMSAGAAWARLSADLGSWYLQGFGVWAIKEKSQGEILGTCGFWQGRDWPRELTWWLLPQYRGQGFAKEASLAAVRHAYEAFA